jgi:hypothetical protein
MWNVRASMKKILFTGVMGAAGKEWIGRIAPK